jgi:soluble lytic murein transglycosylase-like protein
LLESIARRVALAGAAVASIAFTAAAVRPVYAGRAPVVKRLVGEAWRDSAAAALAERAPWATAPIELAIGSPRFEADRRAFAKDLLATGNVGAARADSLATFAVREADQRRVPPALVFGVMMVENPDLKSSARSSVGAVGLMQIYPRAWKQALSRRFGSNLRDDQTNLRYGVFILSHLVYKSDVWGNHPDSTIRKGLLRYNGCVRGTNTRNCHRYPDVVRDRIEQLAVAQCGADAFGYSRCVSEPLRLSMRGD